jgi:signal transduction histidine kinase
MWSQNAPASQAADERIDALCPHPTGEWWSRGWHLLFYGALAFGLAGTVVGNAPTSRLALVAALSAALGSWYWLWVGRGRLRSSGARAAYFIVAGALWTALIAMEPAYELVAFSAFIQVTGYLSWRGAVPALLGVVAILELHPLARGGTVGFDGLIGGLITLTIAAMAILPMRAIHAESNRRQRLIEELEQTRYDLAVAERHAGMLEERERLAGDIHDTVAQGLSSIVMLLEAVQASLGSSAPGPVSHIEQALQAARDNLREVRRLVWALRPESLEKGTLGEAVQRLAEAATSDGVLDVRAIVDGSVRRLPTEIEVTVLRAAQELLSNVRRHAAATRATMALTYEDDGIRLEARDDGQGLDADSFGRRPGQDGGLGLVMMRERVEALGGSMHIDGRIGAGTTVVIRLPLADSPTPQTRSDPEVRVR